MRRGDAACQVVGFALASGVSQLCVMGQPEEIGVGEGGGVESDAVEGVAGERKCAVGCVHGFPFSIVRPDALTPALSHRAEGSPQINASTEQSPRPSGERVRVRGIYGGGGHSVHFMFLATL
jgi:hypothetical protein